VNFRAMLLVAIDLIIQSATGNAQPPVLRVLHSILDKREPGGPIGARDVLGLMFGESSPRVDFDNLTLILPAHPEPRLCVSVTARNETYKGLFEYDVVGAGQGQRKLDIASQHLGYLRSFAAMDLGISAWLAQVCEQDASDNLRIPVTWRAQSGAGLHVFINSRTYTASLVLDSDPNGPPMRCEELMPVEPSFNRDCVVTLGPKNHGIVALKLQMFRFGNLIDESRLRVSVP
jgi:hypothetical protein